MPSLTCTRVAVISIAAVLLQAAGLSLFVIGFFPVKSALSGVSGTESFSFPSCNSTNEGSQKTQWTPPDRLRSIYEELSQIPASFDRLILMVVDGLPAEFVLGRGDLPPKKTLMDAMPYTQSLLSSGRAMGFHAKAAPPTVTMPRLKAMVSGAIGGFLDVAFNFNTQALLDDNLLGQFDNIGWKMVMFGDETWIKLFPRLFTRHDGVSSFFVKDTVEVDHNVSRHLEVELVSDDWDLLILHYLGLDHIGHIGGRHSILMPQKMKEMDEVIKIIHMNTILHEGLDRKRTLLVVTSDHGMTDSGNHGGSSYEETDSLALFIGLGPKTEDYAFTTQNTAFQVDITPTLALLFGVPIPKNSVGVFIPGVLDSMTDKQQLRAKELNSWQLVRLLQEQLPGLLCESSSCKGVNLEQDFETSRCRTGAEKLCCLFFKAVALHNSWKSQRVASPMSNYTDDLHRTIVAYDEFLRSAAEWLSRRVTDKPLDLLASGIFVMLLSSTMLISLVFWLSKQVGLTHFKSLSNSSVTHKWNLDEPFALAAVVIHLLSLCASSMVEEEQYIWHFLTSTLFFMFLITSIQSCHAGTSGRYLEIFCIFVVLICGRILRGWHQGGVNWTYLHDISKWLENAGSARISALQIASVLFTTGLGFLVLYQVSSMKFLVSLVQVSVLMSGFLVVLYITESSNYSGTLIAQTIFLTLGVTSIGTTLASPWIISVSRFQALKTEHSSSPSIDMQIERFLMGLRDLSYLIGWTLVICWCFLQLLVQQPVNACPVFLMLLQILASMKYFSTAGSHHKSWVQVAGLYFLGMAGHFGLGNSNSLATIDVAGAFIGISSHSTVISGILLFIITYASPLLFLIGLVIYVPAKEMQYRLDSKCADLGYYLQIKIGIPSLVPLAMNSVVLTTFTIILLLMRNHLFVWSVFSPKYLYVVAATVSVTIGVSVMAATGAYSCLVFFFRTKMFYSKMGPYLSHQ